MKNKLLLFINCSESLAYSLFAFFICLYPKLLPLLSILIALAILFHEKRKPDFKKLFDFRSVFPWMIAFYFAHVIGLWNTQNMHFAWMDLGMKASFLLFPLVFTMKRQAFSFPVMMNAFLIGATLSVVIAFGFLWKNYQLTNNIHESIQLHFAWSMHRGYWASYLCMAFCWAGYSMLLQFKKGYWLIPTMLLLATGIVLSSSKAGIFILCLCIISIIGYAIIRTKKYVLAATILIMLLVLGYVGAKNLPGVTARFKLMFQELTHPKKLDITSVESNTARILQWETAVELIKENPIFGVGTGDIKDALKQRNLQKGYTGIANENLNAHNQFFNTQLALGILGSIALIGIFVRSFMCAGAEHRSYIRWILLLFFLSMLTESFLETQAGILPFAFFVCLFGSQYESSMLTEHLKNEYPTF